MPNKLLSGRGCPKCATKKRAQLASDKRRKTHEQFVEQMIEANPGVEVLGRYQDSHTKILVRCVECFHEWHALPNNLLQGRGCPLCARRGRTVSIDTFAEELSQKNPSISLLGGYEGVSKKALFRCEVCGHEWSTLPSLLLSGTGCPECGKVKVLDAAHRRMRTDETFRKELNEVNDTIEPIERYASANIPILMLCKTCGYEWKATPSHLLNGTSCPRCAGNLTLSHEDFIEALPRTGTQIEVLGQYCGSGKPIEVRCKICGYEWSPVAGSLLSGAGCPSCAGILKKSDEDFKNELMKVNPTVICLDTYDGAYKKLRFRCSSCGKEWQTTPHAILSGTGCPRCNRSGTSFFEQALLATLKAILGDDFVISRDRSAIGMELDIYVPTLRLAFEPGSWYYHKDRLDSDAKKRNDCANAGISLITIYSSFPDDSVPPFDTRCLTTPLALGLNDWDAAKDIIDSLLEEQSISANVIDWDTIRRDAIKYSRRRSTEDFAVELASVNPDIIVLGEYLDARSKILVSCRKCGHEWQPAASSLLSGHGCPSCARQRISANQRKTTEQFAAELAGISPSISVLGEYVKSSTKIEVQCLACNYIWSTLPTKLLKGKGCPQCGGNAPLTSESFATTLANKNPAVIPIGDYVNRTTKLEVKCRTCGNRWYARPSDLLRGRGCPKCGRKKVESARRKSNEDFVQQLASVNQNIVALDQYSYAREKIRFRCLACGNIWTATPDNVLRGRGCPSCARTRRSRN